MDRSQEQLRRHFAYDFEMVVNYKLQGLTPPMLREQGRIDEATKLGLSFDVLNTNKLMTAADQMVEKLKKARKKKPRASRRPPPPPEQITLEEIYPGSVREFYKWGPEEPLGPPTAIDPEAKLARVHQIFQHEPWESQNHRDFITFVEWERDRLWQQLKKILGLPNWKEKREYLSEDIQILVSVMQETMPELWQKIVKSESISFDERKKFQEIASSDPRSARLFKRKRWS